MKKYTFRNIGEYMKDNPKGYWFKRKLYGWGWIPVKWQGWAVTFLFIAIIFLEALFFVEKVSLKGGPTGHDMISFYTALVVVVVVLVAICYMKGESPRWMWGSD